MYRMLITFISILILLDWHMAMEWKIIFMTLRNIAYLTRSEEAKICFIVPCGGDLQVASSQPVRAGLASAAAKICKGIA